MSKPRPFDLALFEIDTGIEAIKSGGPESGKQQIAELRAAIAVLKACAAIDQRHLEISAEHSTDLCGKALASAILKARKIAGRAK